VVPTGKVILFVLYKMTPVPNCDDSVDPPNQLPGDAVPSSREELKMESVTSLDTMGLLSSISYVTNKSPTTLAPGIPDVATHV